MTTSFTSIVAHDSQAIALEMLLLDIKQKSAGKRPDAVIVFASCCYDHAKLLQAIHDSCHPGVLVGCSSGGEFVNDVQLSGSITVMAVFSDTLRFSAYSTLNLQADYRHAAADLSDQLEGLGSCDYRYHTGIVFADALSGFTEEFVQCLVLATQGQYQMIGAGAADDAKFKESYVFVGNRVLCDAAVVLEILSNEPVGIGYKHGWNISSDAMRVTEASAQRLVSVNAMPTIEAFQDFSEWTKQTLDRDDPLPFFLNNLIGVQKGDGMMLRMPISINDDGSVTCVTSVPSFSKIHFMYTSKDLSCRAAMDCIEMALARMEGVRPAAAIMFDCVASRLRMGSEFSENIRGVSEVLEGHPLIGCNTYGQFARIDGQYDGIHNCTSIVCLLP